MGIDIEMALASGNVTPIVVRGTHVVCVANLPHDLTEQEAERINLVIKAMVNEQRASGAL